MKVAILISGRGSNMAALLEAARAEHYPAEIALVIASDPSAPGLVIAARAGVCAKSVDRSSCRGRAAFEHKIAELLAAHGIELVCLAGFMCLLSAEFVDQWRDRIINIHPSLLPAFKGLNTHARVLDAGVWFTGCSVHFVRAAVDDGPIIGQAVVPVMTTDDADSLAARVLLAEHILYPTALYWLAAGKIKAVGEHVQFEIPAGGGDDAPGAIGCSLPLWDREGLAAGWRA